VKKIEPSLRAKLQTLLPGEVRLIIRVDGDVPRAATRLMEQGVTVLRSFHLIPALAIRCSAEQALALLEEPWVQAVEEDRRVSVQRHNEALGSEPGR